LFALLEAQESSGDGAGRRRLQERPDPLDMGFCMNEFMNGTFNQDCIDFARAQKAAADQA